MSINIEFQWSEDVYLTAGEIAQKYKMTHTWRKYVGHFFIGLVIFGAIKLTKEKDYSILYIGLILSIYWYYIRNFIYRARLKESFKKEGIEQLKMQFNISKGGVNINGNMIPWRDISLVILHPKGFLLERPEGYPYIPATAFEKDKDVEYFINLIEKNDINLIKLI